VHEDQSWHRVLFADFAQRSVLDWLPVLEDRFLADGAEPAEARRAATLTLARAGAGAKSRVDPR
jgi:hypothetical protein